MKNVNPVSRRAIRTSAIMLALSFIFLSFSASYAWFSANRHTDSSGMTLSADVSANLAIAKTAAEVATLIEADDPFSVTWEEEDGRTKMLPATHGGSGETLLQYVTNPEEVGLKSGLKKGTTDLTLAAVEKSTDNTSLYYVDYTVYITSLAADLKVSSLTATVELTSPDTTPVADTHNAASIDFYVNGTYVDTLNVAGKDSTNTGSAKTTTATLVAANTTIAKDTTELVVVMRCYFDGALLKTTTSPQQAYVNTYNVDTSDLTLKVTFTATEATSST